MIRQKRKSGTTQILNAISSTPIRSWKMEQDETKNNFTFLLAYSLNTRRNAYSLAQKVFTELVYINESPQYDVHDYDAAPNTFTLVVKDQFNKAIATISTIFDEETILPCYEDFSEEIKPIQERNGKIAEVVRLAIAPEYRHSKFLLAKLFNMMFLYTHHIMNYTDIVIEVSKRHAKFYKHILAFDILGKTKPCTRVNGNPSNILHAKCHHIQEMITEKENLNSLRKSKNKIYSLAVCKEQELEIIQYFQSNKRAMTIKEIEYFNLNKPINKAYKNEKQLYLIEAY